jgi:hypothetical protein
VDEFSRELPCRLSDAEVAERADAMARAIEQRDEVDAERVATAKGFKRQLDGIQELISQLARQVRDRSESREVPCKTEVDSEGCVLVIRQDTGEVIEQRNAQPGEQLRLRMQGKEYPAEPAEPAKPDDPPEPPYHPPAFLLAEGYEVSETDTEAEP